MVHPVDAHVGRKVREIRLLRGLTQANVAEQLGLSFQQLQKYETGHNRVSASRMFEIARLLNVEPAYFFEGYDDGAGKTSEHLDERTAKAAKALSSITDEAVRNQIQTMIMELAGRSSGELRKSA
ncbi:helix-turn-helix transcriptional regulator [Aliiroseovarius sp. KMU-50]|uniref:Helix-turn-helix transcriptional regulator n=1 Tax=Aliiroseovarius salicola TaxID=3009082 RepID=A0ABT4VZZ2_9RHOB|nr:helix-turn-helix transcriptional regulator [Aliiroseovarius sp. KMU-50]MDA5093832.1 helix-turn-helix transcriptional regulator [Aliiroseovarius sp. KMU-50]